MQYKVDPPQKYNLQNQSSVVNKHTTYLPSYRTMVMPSNYSFSGKQQMTQKEEWRFLAKVVERLIAFLVIPSQITGTIIIFYLLNVNFNGDLS